MTTKLFPSTFTRGALACLPLLLAACGGGGDGGSPTPVTALAITSANDTAVAADGLSASTSTGLANSGAAIVTGVQVDAASGAAGGASGPALLAAAALKLATIAPSSSAQATGITFSQTTRCTYGGSLSVSGSLNSGNGLGPTDHLAITATSCAESVGGVDTVMTGSLTMTVASGSYTLGVYPQRIVLDLVARNLTVATPTETDVSNGDMRLDLSLLSATSATEVLSGSELTYGVTTAAGKRSVTLKDYAQTVSIDGTTVTYSTQAAVETTNRHVGHVRYTVATPTPIVNRAGVFASGSLQVTGDKSSLLVTITGDDAFLLELDSDGDGKVDATSNVTRADVAAQL